MQKSIHNDHYSNRRKSFISDFFFCSFARAIGITRKHTIDDSNEAQPLGNSTWPDISNSPDNCAYRFANNNFHPTYYTTIENIEDKMNEDLTPISTGDEMNVEEADTGNAMDAAPIKPDEEQMDVDEANSSEAMDL